MLFNCVEKYTKAAEFSVDFSAVWIIDNERNGQNVEAIAVQWFRGLLHTQEHLILLWDAMVVLKVIHKVPLAMLAKELKFNRARVGSPLEVK